MKISGKVVLVTGASEGIGAACVRAFRSRGAQVCLTARSAEKLQQVRSGTELAIEADLMHEGAPAHIVQSVIRERGRLDILVNNAGVGVYQPSYAGSTPLVRSMFELNLFAPLSLVAEAVPHMRRQGEGMIVNVASVAAAVTLPWVTMYSASKAAMLSMTNGLRIELRSSGIQCMGVLPGYVRTRFQSNILAGEVPKGLASLRQHWAITADRCAEDIVSGVERNARTVVTPRIGWALIAASHLFPAMVERRMAAMLEGSEAGPEVALR